MTPIRQVPDHLLPYVAKQDPSMYTPIDHATWRYIMKLSKKFFSTHAHKVYLDGLNATGINTERVPLIKEMDEKLQKFGWRAVPIVGFIPPAPFMEFLSLGILPIACDMRKIENLSYTPAPDIVHEAAGHAPIIADPDFAHYLKSYGEIARKVILTHKDETVYSAIRKLSDLKENPATTEKEIAEAQKEMDEAFASLDEVSENIMLTRMGWWTFEYGLVGSMNDPKIYGAGLLSSVGESYHCFSNDVKKVPFSIDCIHQNFDITKPQPQLFVTPDFATLNRELEKLANLMAYRVGGFEGLEKARRAKTVTTTQFDSGIQIGGKVLEILTDKNGQPVYLRFDGGSQLAFEDVQLDGHGIEYHSHGFGTPVGKMTNFNRAELVPGKKIEIRFESGVMVSGIYKSMIEKKMKPVVLSFDDCTVTFQGRKLFEPSWGVFDMAVGEKVVSVFGGAPDRAAYMKSAGAPNFKTSQSSNETAENKKLNELYLKVRKIRDEKRADAKAELASVARELEKYPDDWLLRYELLELGITQTKPRLLELAKTSGDVSELIQRGLEVL